MAFQVALKDRGSSVLTAVSTHRSNRKRRTRVADQLYRSSMFPIENSLPVYLWNTDRCPRPLSDSTLADVPGERSEDFLKFHEISIENSNSKYLNKVPVVYDFF